MKVDLESEYGRAFAEVVKRVQLALGASLPVSMQVAGGAALHLLTGERGPAELEAAFSRKVRLDEEIAVAYRDADGRARLLYLERGGTAPPGLLHAQAGADSSELEIPGLDRGRLEVRVLTPLDLAVSQLARFEDLDREAIETLAKRGLIDAASLRRRAHEALGGFAGDPEPVLTSIEVACRLVDAVSPPRAAA
jgi:hypothetical protein